MKTLLHALMYGNAHMIDEYSLAYNQFVIDYVKYAI